jgi:prepilin-type N-terminal cleavage/methylation domain-containing protein
VEGRREGFTLVELLAVTVIIGILAVAAVPRLAPAPQRVSSATLTSDLRALASLQAAFRSEHPVYAANQAELGWRSSPGVSLVITASGADGWAATASHARVPEGRCAIYVGGVDPTHGAPATTPGVVACTF